LSAPALKRSLIEETELIPDVETENLELLTDEELLNPLMEIC